MGYVRQAGGRCDMRRGYRLARAAVVLLVVLGSVLFRVTPAEAAEDLPDLGMARLTDVKVDKAAGGRLVLRYTTVVVNVGPGRLEVLAQRQAGASQMTPVQRIYSGTASRDVPVNGTMFYAGDGHDHWHFAGLETAELVRVDNGVKVGTSAKRGFCFFDNSRYRLTLPGAPTEPVYTVSGCGNSTSLAITMGLSVGWGDAYYWNLPDQFIDITGLTAGRYRLLVTANANGALIESNTQNNQTWVDLQLKGQGQPKIIGYGPTA